MKKIVLIISTCFSLTACSSDTIKLNTNNDEDTNNENILSNTPTNRVILPCDQLGNIEEFQDITPPELKNAGNIVFDIAVDPINSGVIYVGSIHAGLWKSENCGANWIKIATGTLGDAINAGMTWSLAIDPINSDVYAVSGYAAPTGTSGLYKSTNGGVDWRLIWPPAHQSEWNNLVLYDFANVVTIDPEDRNHIVLTFHAYSFNKVDNAGEPIGICIGESFDGGENWRIIEGKDEWTGWEGQSIFFLDRTTWLWASQESGSWILEDIDPENTNNEKVEYTATKIPNMVSSHLQSIGFTKSITGRYFFAGLNSLWTSTDGKANNWEAIENTGPIIGGVVTAKNTIYASNCYFEGACLDPESPFFIKSVNDGLEWTKLTHPEGTAMGGTLEYDPGHNLIYSSGGNHVFRFKVQ